MGLVQLIFISPSLSFFPDTHPTLIKTGYKNRNFGFSRKSSVVVKEKSVSVVLLAGGKGKRIGVSMPKQYLPLLGHLIALYSFYTFSHMPELKEIVVVCDPSYQDIFEDSKKKISLDLKFSLPENERQDSVYSGFQAIDSNSELVCIHDSARPLVTSGDVAKDCWLIGAAVLGVPSKATIKEITIPDDLLLAERILNM